MFTPENAPATWAEVDWPAWVPEKWRKLIAEFWSCFGRIPAQWAQSWRDETQRGCPAMGARVRETRPALGRKAPVSGRWVHTWNNMGILVDDDGVAHVSSTSAGLVSVEAVAP